MTDFWHNYSQHPPFFILLMQLALYMCSTLVFQFECSDNGFHVTACTSVCQFLIFFTTAFVNYCFLQTDDITDCWPCASRPDETGRHVWPWPQNKCATEGQGVEGWTENCSGLADCLAKLCTRYQCVCVCVCVSVCVFVCVHAWACVSVFSLPTLVACVWDNHLI